MASADDGDVYYYVDLQNVVQGPYPWSNLDQWLVSGFIREDLLVNKAGETQWIALRDMASRRKLEGPGIARTGGGVPPPAAPRPIGNATKGKNTDGANDESPSDEKTGDATPVVVASRYAETVDRRIERMIAEGKFGVQLTKLATGGGGIPNDGKAEASGKMNGAADGKKRKADGPGAIATDVDDDRKKAKSAKKSKEAAYSKTIDGFNEWRHVGGYPQLAVFEPAKPVEVSTKVSKDAVKDPRKEKEKEKETDPKSEKLKEIDLPVPAWCVEDAIEQRRRKEKEKTKEKEKHSSGFDRGGPRPAADPKAEDSDNDSDVSWSALPGTGEPVELIEERKRAKQDQLAKAVAEAEASAAAAAATAAAKRKKENEATVVTVTEKTDEEKEAEKNTELALCFTEPLSGVWHVPLSSDGWRWKEGGSDAHELSQTLEEWEDAPRRVVARRELDDAFRVFGVGGYGGALRGVGLDTGKGKGNSAVSAGVSKQGGVQATVAAAKATSEDAIKAWFRETTKDVEPKSPSRSEIEDIAVDPAELAEINASAVLSANSAKSESIGEWFEICTRDVVVEPGERERKKTQRIEPTTSVTDSDANKTHVKCVMDPSPDQESAAARVMGALHDAVMRQRARVFYELVREGVTEAFGKR